MVRHNSESSPIEDRLGACGLPFDVDFGSLRRPVIDNGLGPEPAGHARLQDRCHSNRLVVRWRLYEYCRNDIDFELNLVPRECAAPIDLLL